MQFKVPQFLDIEDKIFGPFTFRQFVYLAGGAGISFMLYKILGFVLGAIPILFVAGLSAALTFYRPNNKPFVEMLEAGFRYFSQNKLYIWKKRPAKKTRAEEGSAPAIEASPLPAVGKLDKGRLRDLAWSLDVLDVNKQKKN